MFKTNVLGQLLYELDIGTYVYKKHYRLSFRCKEERVVIKAKYWFTTVYSNLGECGWYNYINCVLWVRYR